MIAELAKTYDPAAVEAEIYRIWLDEKCFEADPSRAGEPYSIVIPPPNVTGALHLGHAINNTLQDILTRVHRMRGFNTVWIPGIDHAGIATQAVVEKQLKEKENKTRHDVGRECLVKRIWAWKEQFGDRILSQLQRLGCSCDWSRTRFTLDDMCARAVRETFFKLFKDGLVYRGKRLVNWDVHLQTSISDDEIYHETVKTFLWHIKYPIVLPPSPGTPGEGRGEGAFDKQKIVDDPNHPHPNPLPEYRERGPEPRATHMIVATTRPETLLGDTAVAVHSQDHRWNWAIGLQVELPLTGRKIPIIADDILVDMKFGSGVVKVTPGHDPNDYAVYTRHLGKSDEIAIINLLNPDGTLNENAGKYAGLKREAARKAVVKDLGDLLVKEEPYETQVGHSDRSKTAVEPYLSDQWFVKMAPLAEPALEVVRNGTIKFFPERHAQQYLSWLGEKRDWPISRQLWWGHQIPVWTRILSVEVTPESGSMMASVRGLTIGKLLDDSTPLEGNTEILARQTTSVTLPDGRRATAIHVCIAPGNSEWEEGLRLQGFERDPDVLDTWFSSALWPHSTLGWPDRTADLARWYPTSVLMTGRDIITLWVARMVMMGMYNMGSRGNDERGTMNDEQKRGNDEQNSGVHRSTLSVPHSEEHWTYSRRLTTKTRGEFFFNARPGIDSFYVTDADGNRVDPATFPIEVPEQQERAYVIHLLTTKPEPELERFGFVRAHAPQRDTGLRPVTEAPELDKSQSSRSEGNSHGPEPRVTLARLGVPFAHVSINPTILDGKGERMSKSKGNGVDPVDIIDTHGADALRFTMTTMATETQDARMPVQVLCPHCSERFDNPEGKAQVTACPKCKKKLTRPFENAVGSDDAPLCKMTSKRFDDGRNFCTKLWNASKFVMGSLEQSTGTGTVASATMCPGAHTVAEATMPAGSLVDQWIVSRFNRAVTESNDALETYRFDQYAKACYDFFWRDFCDWYLEAIKPAMKDPARQGSTAKVLFTVLDGLLRLMHPMIPFITEKIWANLHPGTRLVTAAWPVGGPIDADAEHVFPRMQAVIVAIRNVRNEYKVNPRQVTAVHLSVPSNEALRVTQDNREMIELLGTCSIEKLGSDLPAPVNAARGGGDGFDVYVLDLIDPAAEKARDAKKIETLIKERDALIARLANPSYADKAPAHLVQQTRDKLASVEAELAKLNGN